MNEAFEKDVMEYLTMRRMSSLGNVAVHFDCPVDQILPNIQSLLSKERIRAANSHCASGCSSCSGCESDPAGPQLTERTILISLETQPEAL